MAMGGIAANWGFRPQNSPSRGGPEHLSKIMLLGTTRVSLPNGISFLPTALAGCTSVTDDEHTDVQNGNVLMPPKSNYVYLLHYLLTYNFYRVTTSSRQKLTTRPDAQRVCAPSVFFRFRLGRRISLGGVP